MTDRDDHQPEATRFGKIKHHWVDVIDDCPDWPGCGDCCIKCTACGMRGNETDDIECPARTTGSEQP